DAGHELRDGEALVLAIRNRLEEARPNVRPIVLRAPAALGAEDALKDHASVADLERLVESHVPAGRRVQRIDHGLVPVGRHLVHGEPARAHQAGGLAILLAEDVGPGPAVRLRWRERPPALAVLQVRRRLAAAAALRLHAAAGHQLAQHVADHRPPLVLRRRPTFGVDHPLGGVAAEGFCQLLRALGEEVPEPALAPSAHVEQPVHDGCVAPFKVQAARLLRGQEPLFPRLEGEPSSVGEMAALDAEVVDALREVEHVVALDVEVEEGVEPFGAGVEVDLGADVVAVAQLGVPGAHATALEAGAGRDAVRLEAARVVFDHGGAPVGAGDGAPRATMADVAALVGRVDAERCAPALARVDESLLVADGWAPRTSGDDGLEPLGAHDGAETVRGYVVVVVHQHRRADEVLAGGADARDARILAADLAAEHLFGLAGALSPHGPRVADLGAPVVQVEVHGAIGLARDDDSVEAGSLHRHGPEAARRAAAEGVARGRAGIDGGHLGAAGREAGAGDRPGHHTDHARRAIGLGVRRYLIQEDVRPKCLAAPVLPENRLFGQLDGLAAPRGEVDAEQLAHVPARQRSPAHRWEEQLVARG